MQSADVPLLNGVIPRAATGMTQSKRREIPGSDFEVMSGRKMPTTSHNKHNPLVENMK